MSKDEIKKFTQFIIEEINHLDNEASMEYKGSSMDRIHNLYRKDQTHCLQTSGIELV